MPCETRNTWTFPSLWLSRYQLMCKLVQFVVGGLWAFSVSRSQLGRGAICRQFLIRDGLWPVLVFQAAVLTYRWEILFFNVDWAPIWGLYHLAEFGEVVQNSLKASNPLLALVKGLDWDLKVTTLVPEVRYQRYDCTSKEGLKLRLKYKNYNKLNLLTKAETETIYFFKLKRNWNYYCTYKSYNLNELKPLKLATEIAALAISNFSKPSSTLA